MHVTEIVDGKVVSAYVCGKHVTDISGAGKTHEPRHHVQADPVAMAEMGELFIVPLCEGLRDANAEVRLRCIYILPVLGTAATPAIPAIRKLINDPDERVRSMAIMAIQWINLSPPETKAEP